MFYCDKPADKGGETPICLSHLVYQQIKKEFPDFMEEIAAKVNFFSRWSCDTKYHVQNEADGFHLRVGRQIYSSTTS